MSEKSKIKESLIKQLKGKGADIGCFMGLVDDYCWYWEQEKAMQKDIKVKGRTYIACSASGKEYDKENPSVKNAMLYNKQKLSILKELALTTNNVMSDEDDKL